VTKAEFIETRFCAGMSAIYKGCQYEITAVDFTKSLVFLDLIGWKHRQHITLLNGGAP
jgi:hypothetical protein